MPMSPGGFNVSGVEVAPHPAACPIMRRITGDGVELNVLDEGDGPAVLLLHGFPDSARLWRRGGVGARVAGARTRGPARDPLGRPPDGVRVARDRPAAALVVHAAVS